MKIVPIIFSFLRNSNIISSRITLQQRALCVRSGWIYSTTDNINSPLDSDERELLFFEHSCRHFSRLGELDASFNDFPASDKGVLWEAVYYQWAESKSIYRQISAARPHSPCCTAVQMFLQTLYHIINTTCQSVKPGLQHSI